MNVLESIKRFLGLKKKKKNSATNAPSDGEGVQWKWHKPCGSEAEEASEHRGPRGTTSGATRQGQGQGGVRVVATGRVVEWLAGGPGARSLD